MPVFEKDVLYPGTWRLADGRRVTYTPQDVRHYHDRLKAMLAAGIQVPVCKEHQDEAKPLTPAQQKAARAWDWQVGHVKDVRLAPEGYLVAELDVPIAKDAERLPAVRFASPEIADDFTDGDGTKWPGKSITHVAATPRPVQHQQKPFKLLRMSVIRLSLGDYEMADDKDKDKPGDGADDAASGQAKKLKEVVDALKEDGYGLPDDTDMSNLLDRLHTAALTKKAATDGGNTEPAEPEPEPPPPVAMSLDARLARSEARLLNGEKKLLKDRIAALFSTGRVTKPIKDKLLADLGTVRLSLDANGELNTNAVSAKVEAYEALPKGCAFPVADRLSLDGSPPQLEPADLPPEAMRTPQTPAEVDAALKAWDATMGR